MAALARLIRILRVLTAVAVLAVLMLSASAALADCPNGTVLQWGQCLPCPPHHVLNASKTKCVCPPNDIEVIQGGSKCVPCQPNQVPDAHQHQCIACPVSTEARFGRCVPTLTPSHPVAVPGLLDSTPGLGGQGPAGIGTPRGGGSRAR
jgi:hypothetical protein